MFAEMLLDDHRGVYIPRDFAEEFNHELLTGYSWEDVEKLKQIGNSENPEPENCQIYWELWNRILENARFEDSNGNIWMLHQDGAVWLVCPDLMTQEEAEDFFGV